MFLTQSVNVDVANQWAYDVVTGKIAAGELTKLACQRHIDDLDTAKDRGLLFDEDEAQRVLDFFSLLRHSKGKWAGQKFELMPWQQFIIINAYGWYRFDGTRRYRQAIVFVPRKNGKSTLLSGVSLYALVADGEQGAEIYTAATKKDQAKITFEESCRMRDSSPELRSIIKKFKNNLHIEGTASKLEPLSADANSLDGLNLHHGIVDEIHAHKTREVWDVLDSATGARDNPMMWAISTAGFNLNGIGYELYQYVEKILRGAVDDDSVFGIIFSADQDDDWTDELTWQKANPSFGVSVNAFDLSRKVRKAKIMATERNNFMCKHLNVWTTAEDPWMNMERWHACGGEVDLNLMAAGKVPCWAGLDLASTSDIAAFLLAFKADDGYKVWGKYYLPEDAVMTRVQKQNVPYDVWAREGRLTLTPGNVTDYNFIKKDILDIAERFNLKEIAYDRYNATQLVNDLMDEGMQMVGFGQGFVSMSAPTKELERLVMSGGIAHGGDPVLTWMASNVVVKQDEADNLKPDKRKSSEKIDGIVSLIMAIGRLMVDESPAESVYESRGVLTF